MFASRMKAVLAASLMVVLAACQFDRSPTSPARESATAVAPAEVQSSLIGTLTGTTSNLLGSLTLVSCKTPSYGTVSKSIGFAGGTIAIGPHSLVIPPGALSKTTTITATAPAGNRVFVDFQPHGLRFATPTALTLSYKHCLLPPLAPRIVYVDDRWNILEVLSPSLSLLKGSVTGKLDHFSGYAIATRSATR